MSVLRTIELSTLADEIEEELTAPGMQSQLDFKGTVSEGVDEKF